MDRELFDRLYLGYAAENLVASQLYRQGFEVFRLPADFGLDLVVTNQFRTARKQADTLQNFSFALQVKSRWLKPSDTTDGPSGRPETVVAFQFKKDELELVTNQSNAGVVMVAYFPIGTDGPDLFYLWLHSEQLKSLIGSEFLVFERERWKLTICYRQLPRQDRETFVKEIETETGKLPFEVKKKLLRDLPPTFGRNWNARDYLAFARKARNDSDSLVFKAVSNVPMNLDTFPAWKPLRGLD